MGKIEGDCCPNAENDLCCAIQKIRTFSEI